MTEQFKLNFEDAVLVSRSKDEAKFLGHFLQSANNPKALFNLYLQGLRSEINMGGITFEQLLTLKPAIIDISDLIINKKIMSSDAIKHLLPELINNPTNHSSSMIGLAKTLNIFISEEPSDETSTIIDAIIADFPDKVSAYKKGKKDSSASLWEK